ncbi:MAG: hypothetical protein Q9208_003413 [Pyrenodesmia sp. 3 TL-2023]
MVGLLNAPAVSIPSGRAQRPAIETYLSSTEDSRLLQHLARQSTLPDTSRDHAHSYHGPPSKSNKNNNDLDQHKSNVHKIIPKNSSDGSYRCAARNCIKREKIWPRIDNFRQHCLRMHQDEDCEDLVRNLNCTRHQSRCDYKDNPLHPKESVAPSGPTDDLKGERSRGLLWDSFGRRSTKETLTQDSNNSQDRSSGGETALPKHTGPAEGTTAESGKDTRHVESLGNRTIGTISLEASAPQSLMPEKRTVLNPAQVEKVELSGFISTLHRGTSPESELAASLPKQHPHAAATTLGRNSGKEPEQSAPVPLGRSTGLVSVPRSEGELSIIGASCRHLMSWMPGPSQRQPHVTRLRSFGANCVSILANLLFPEVPVAAGKTRIRWTCFELHPKDLVDVRKVPDMPPESRKEEYLYQTCDLIPPIGENLMTHLFHHPHEANEKAITFTRSPKKRKQRLAVCAQMGTSLGWGIHLVEGWAWTKIWLLSLTLFLLSSLVFAISWSILKHDLQGAFGVAAYFVALVALGIGTVQAYINQS